MSKGEPFGQDIQSKRLKLLQRNFQNQLIYVSIFDRLCNKQPNFQVSLYIQTCLKKRKDSVNFFKNNSKIMNNKKSCWQKQFKVDNIYCSFQLNRLFNMAYRFYQHTKWTVGQIKVGQGGLQTHYNFIVQIMKCGKCSKSEAVSFCGKCNSNYCLVCLKADLIGNQHYDESYYFCQECQEQRAAKFCFSCDQHLCELCNGKIHNKGKRALHAVEQFSQNKLRVIYTVVIMGDCKGLCEDSNELFLILCEKLPSNNSESELATQNIHLFIEGTAPFDLSGFSYTTVAIEQLNEQFLTEYCKYFTNLCKTVMIDSPEARKLKGKLTIQLSLLPVGQTSINNSVNNYVEPRVNLSTSTENQSIVKTRKPPIAYFQFYKLTKEDKRAEAEIKMRKLAADGVLILKRKDVEPVEGVIRSFVRTIGDVEVEYCSLEISYISVESLVWIIRSIKIDCMTPGEKLILSRIKESFDIKFHSKFWQSILNYLSSSRYQVQYDRGSFGYTLPKILVNKNTEEIQLLLKGQEWVFEDQEKLDENCEAWKDFTKFILEYFEKNKTIPGGRYGCVQYVKTFGPQSLKNTSLGRLSLFVQESINKGIIRYHKTLLIKNVVEEQVSFTNESSSFQQGDYSFSLNEKSLYMLQKELKIRTLQSALINILIENQHQGSLSLAQIPLFLKKAITFNFNLPDLGFPKLKNLIHTLSDKIDLEINKSTLTYTFTSSTEMLFNLQKDRLRRIFQDFLKIIIEILTKIMRYLNSMMVQDLYTELNTKLGFEFQYRIYNAPDFCHFIYYYCQEVIHIQFISGVFMAYSKQQQQHLHQKQHTRMHHQPSHSHGSKSSYKQNPQTTTPNFYNNSFSSKQISTSLRDFIWYNHQFEEEEKKYEPISQVNQQSNDEYQTDKFLEDLLNDEDDKSHTTYKTVICNQGVVNSIDWSISNLISLPPPQIPTKTAHNKAYSEDFDKNHIYYTHGRVMSTVQRKQPEG